MSCDPYSANPGVCAAAECWCTVSNPHTPPAPDDTSIRPGAGAATTPGVETLPQFPPGVSDSDAAVRGGEAATAVSLRWGKWTAYTWPLNHPYEFARILDLRPDCQAGVRIEQGTPVVYMRWAL
jgi:hypothetical protein